LSSLESRKLKTGTSWRVAYLWNGQKENVKIGFTTKKVAKQRQAQIDALIAMGRNPLAEIRKQNTPSDLESLKALDSKWCATRKQPRTIEINDRAMDLLIAFTKNKQIKQIQKPLIEDFVSHLKDKLKMGRTSINIYLRSIKAIFQRAIDEYGLLTEHPFRTVKPLAVSKTPYKATYLSIEQVNLLIDEVSDVHFKRLIKFYAWTGCRQIEAIEMIWDDVDFANDVLYLGNANSMTKLRREFPFTDKLKALITELTLDKGESDKVFWRFANTRSLSSRKLQKIRDRVDELPYNLTLHTLRHAFASHLIMKGVDMSTVASLLGHTTTQITELYSHLQPDHKKAAVDLLPY
jgi:integrase